MTIRFSFRLPSFYILSNWFQLNITFKNKGNHVTLNASKCSLCAHCRMSQNWTKTFDTASYCTWWLVVSAIWKVQPLLQLQPSVLHALCAKRIRALPLEQPQMQSLWLKIMSAAKYSQLSSKNTIRTVRFGENWLARREKRCIAVRISEWYFLLRSL